MKRLYILFCLQIFMGFQPIHAQNDTLFHLDFQVDPSSEMLDAPDNLVTDLWLNWDEDGETSAGGLPNNWFFDLDWGSPDSIPATDSNFVFVSRSWLENLGTNASNWLVSPAIEILDNSAVLSWKSAPFQGPRYLDGYRVKILVGAQGYFEASEVTTVFTASEMTAITGTGASVDTSNFDFDEGYIHAGAFTDTTYFIPADVNASNPAHTGLLEPHSISLSQFEGKTIYVAFHHDSSDDNMIMLDDLLLTGSLTLAAKDLAPDLRFVTYPNPVDNFLNVLFRLSAPSNVSVELFNQDGKLVATLPVSKSFSGEYNGQFDLRNLASGVYTVRLTIDNQHFSKQVVKR